GGAYVPGAARFVQGTLDTLLTADGSVDPAALSLRGTTFVVLYLGRTGGAPAALHHRADRHHRGDAGPRAADRGGTAQLAGVPARLGPGGPQRAVRRRFS